MHRIAFLIVCLFSTLTTIGPSWADPSPAASPTEVVEKLHGGLLAAMKDGPKLGFTGRKALLDPVVRQCFDLITMARVATGSTWQKLSDSDKSRIVATFTTFTVANYASQFKSLDGDKFVTKGEADGGRGRRMVNTDLISPDEDPVELDYQLRQDDGQWKIVDVYLDGSVSQLALRRNEFAASLAAGGVDNLIAQMEKTSANLAKAE